MGNPYSEEQKVYDYPPEFRMQILALMLKEGWLSKYGGVVKPDYFPSEIERIIAANIIRHKESYSALPTRADMILEMPNETKYINDICDLVNIDLSKTQDIIIAWAQNAAMQLALMSAVDDLEVGSLENIPYRINQALQVGKDHEDIGMDLISDSNIWLSDLRTMNTVSTPWNEINSVIDGGLGAGELGLVVAPAGGFKTTGLINIGVHAAGILNKQNVLHFTLEMSEQKVLKRYAARVTSVLYKLGSSSEEEYKEKLINKAKLMLKGSIRVKRFMTGEATISDLEDFAYRLNDSGYNIGTIIVDYPDLLRARRGREQKRFELQEVYEDLRGMAIKLDIPIWGATQGNRASFNKNVITMTEIAEDIGKARTADIILAISQTKDQKDINEARIHMAKVRDGDISGGKSQVKVKINFPAIISTGYASNKEIEEETENTNDTDDDGFWN